MGKIASGMICRIKNTNFHPANHAAVSAIIFILFSLVSAVELCNGLIVISFHRCSYLWLQRFAKIS